MERTKMVIGISDCGRKFHYYEDWIRRFDNRAEVIKLSYHLNNISESEKCDGFLLSGGHDVHPRFYHKPEYLELLDPRNIDEKRDEFELRILEFSQKKNKPVLGICRGLQLVNSYFGGTLVPDILTQLRIEGHDKDEESDALHPIEVKEGTLLSKIAETRRGKVNSAHHQCADKIGEGLLVNAVADDGIIEGLERMNGSNKASVLLVQWHPERLPNQESAFSKNVRSYFLREVTATL